VSRVAELDVVDAHVHFWDPSLLRYPWHSGQPALQRAYLPEDYAPLTNGTVDAVVFVQAECEPSKSGREVQWVERLAARERRIIGIVAFVDMLDERSRSQSLERLAQSPLVVGIRHNIQGNDAGFAVQDAFVRGVRDVGERGLTFDLCITADQLDETTELVSQCPGTRFVLDHCGKPAIRDDAYDAWAEALERLAWHDEVHCKLSGLLTEARPDQQNVEGVRRYGEQVTRCFGPARMIYGSDWPVSVLGGGVERWRSITDELAAPWSAEERHAFYSGNALRFYGLNEKTHG